MRSGSGTSQYTDILDVSPSIARPKYLYRYCPWNDRTKLLLMRNALYLPKASDFNDPFDCRMPICFKDNPDVNADLVWRRLAVKDHAYIWLDSANADSHKYREYKSQLDNAYPSLRLLCFSANKTSIPMWSHYAASHTGVCIRFRINTVDLFTQVAMVKYSNKSPICNIKTCSEEDLLRATILWKAKCWSYEHEWRLVIPNARNRYLHFPPQTLDGVIMGCRMDNEEKEELIRILIARNSTVTLYEAIQSEESFSLRIAPFAKLVSG